MFHVGSAGGLDGASATMTLVPCGVSWLTCRSVKRKFQTVVCLSEAWRSRKQLSAFLMQRNSCSRKRLRRDLASPDHQQGWGQPRGGQLSFRRRRSSERCSRVSSGRSVPAELDRRASAHRQEGHARGAPGNPRGAGIGGQTAQRDDLSIFMRLLGLSFSQSQGHLRRYRKTCTARCSVVTCSGSRRRAGHSAHRAVRAHFMLGAAAFSMSGIKALRAISENDFGVRTSIEQVMRMMVPRPACVPTAVSMTIPWRRRNRSRGATPWPSRRRRAAIGWLAAHGLSRSSAYLRR